MERQQARPGGDQHQQDDRQADDERIVALEAIQKRAGGGAEAESGGAIVPPTSLIRASCNERLERRPHLAHPATGQALSSFPTGCRSRSATTHLIDDVGHRRCVTSMSRAFHLARFR